MDNRSKCLYCGKLTAVKDYIINPGAKNELPSCGKDCFERVKQFAEWEKKTRAPFYITLFFLVFANLLILWFEVEAWWIYLPMMGIGLFVMIIPSVFIRYERYQALGIRKTQIVIRIVALGIVLFSILLTVTNG